MAQIQIESGEVSYWNKITNFQTVLNIVNIFIFPDQVVSDTI